MEKDKSIQHIVIQVKEAHRVLTLAKNEMQTTDLSNSQFDEELNSLINKVHGLSEQLGQFTSLEEVLSAKRFTNKPEVDAKIREKVITTLLENFQFTRLKTETDDIVVIDEKEEVKTPIAQSETIPVPQEAMELAEDPNKDPEIRKEAREAARRDLPNMSVYEQVFNSSGTDADFASMPDLDGLTPEEVKAFLGSVDPATAQKVEQLKRALPKKMDNVGVHTAGKNKSLTRRD
jgi:hypothetical protein